MNVSGSLELTTQEPTRARAVSMGSFGARVLLPLVVLTLPLEFTKVYFPLHVIEVSRVLMVACVALFGFEVLRGRRLVLPSRSSFAGFAVLAVYAAVSAAIVHSENGAKTVAAIALYFAVMVVAYNWLEAEMDHRRVWFALVGSCLGVSVIALVLQFTGTYIWNPDLSSGYHRVSATFADPNILARFLAFSAAAGVVLITAVRGRVGWPVALITASAAAAAAAVPFTYSRAGWLLFFFTIALAAALTGFRKSALALVLVMVLVFGLVLLTNPSVLKRSAQLAAGLNIFGPSRYTWLSWLPLDSERRYLIAAGLAMFQDHTFFGVGFGNYQHEIQTAYSTYIPSNYHTTLSHTTVVTVLAELGLVGLTILVWIVASILWETWRAIRHAGAPAPYVIIPFVGLVAIFADSQVTGRLWDEPYMWVFLGLLYAAQLRLGGARPQASVDG